MKKTKIMSLFVLVVLLLVVLSVFSEAQKAAAATEGKTYTFYCVAHGGPGDAYWARVMKGFEVAAKMITDSTPDTIKAIYVAPVVFSIQEFIEMLNSSIDANPDGLIVSMPDPSAEDELLRRAIKKGIPVVAMDMPDPRPADQKIPYMVYVGGDLFLYGKAAAERILSEFTPKRVVVFNHEPGNVGLEVQTQGFAETMSKAGVPVDKLAIGVDPTQAVEIIRGYFKSRPDTNASFALGPPANVPAIQFYNESGLAGKVVHVTKDFDELTLKGIKEGIIIGTLVPQQYLMGYWPVHILYLYHKNHFMFPVDFVTGPVFVDKSNIGPIEPLILEGVW